MTGARLIFWWIRRGDIAPAASQESAIKQAKRIIDANMTG
ncbi:hypothetical protein DAQ1742_01780 [Dickeya aquatica]|uniref:Uncharacterized protein n=1 Tax=Dickeya aquatica TaxID=1401087 RepID=A0A375A9P7_9GAMM|nr:hypothetical protein DAQ1742_01780 [Dickeya aquatica]